MVTRRYFLLLSAKRKEKHTSRPLYKTCRPITLIEVLIAMTLTTMILMTLMFFYRQVMMIGGDLDEVKREAFYRCYVENRLANTLPRIGAIDSTKKESLLFFSSDNNHLTMPNSQSLFFTFDHGISLDQVFSNTIIGNLYVDKQGQLMLAYWPAPKQWPSGELPRMKKEVLMQKVKSIVFSFYVAEDKELTLTNDQGKDSTAEGKRKQETAAKSDEQEALPPLQEGWHEMVWPRERQQLPNLVKMVVTMDDDQKIVFVFPLVNASTHIIYG